MVKNEPVEAVRLHIESVVPEIETFMENRESMVAPARFSPVNLSVDYTDLLDLFSETRPPIGADVCLEGKKMAVSGEESTQRLARKRRKLLI
jgi:hypothetical protein